MPKLFSKLFGSKNIESLKIDELREMEITLDRKIEELREEVRRIEREIQLLFEKAREAKNRSEELSIARRIKTLSQKKDMKLSAQEQLEKELRAVSNVLILKEIEQDLKSAGVWERIREVDPEKLEDWLLSKNLEAQSREETILSVIQMTSSVMKTGVEYEEDLDEILDAIKAVKSGDIRPEEAGKVLEEKERG